MSRTSKKLIAVLLMLWLPIFSGAALAASVNMQMPQGSCHEMADGQLMADAEMNDALMPAASDDAGASCSVCGLCNIACTGFLAVPNISTVFSSTPNHAIVLLIASWHSISFAPLLPPPLVSA